MSDTILHKQKGKWKNGFQDEMPKKLHFYFFRKDSEYSYVQEHRIWLKEKILRKDFKSEIELIC